MIIVRTSYFTLSASFQVTESILQDFSATLPSETMAPSLLNNGAAFKAFLRTKGGSDEAVGYFVDKIGIKTIVQMARLTKESWAYSTKKLEDPDKVLIPATPAVRARGRGQNAQPAVPAMPARWDTPQLNLGIEFIENLQM